MFLEGWVCGSVAEHLPSMFGFEPQHHRGKKDVPWNTIYKSLVHHTLLQNVEDILIF
jgi:hypothetical protein